MNAGPLTQGAYPQSMTADDIGYRSFVPITVTLKSDPRCLSVRKILYDKGLTVAHFSRMMFEESFDGWTPNVTRHKPGHIATDLDYLLKYGDGYETKCLMRYNDIGHAKLGPEKDMKPMNIGLAFLTQESIGVRRSHFLTPSDRLWDHVISVKFPEVQLVIDCPTVWNGPPPLLKDLAKSRVILIETHNGQAPRRSLISDVLPSDSLLENKISQRKEIKQVEVEVNKVEVNKGTDADMPTSPKAKKRKKIKPKVKRPLTLYNLFTREIRIELMTDANEKNLQRYKGQDGNKKLFEDVSKEWKKVKEDNGAKLAYFKDLAEKEKERCEMETKLIIEEEYNQELGIQEKDSRKDVKIEPSKQNTPSKKRKKGKN